MKIIGLTGGIGSGKTLVSDYLAEKRYPIIDADIIAREIVAPHTSGLEQIVESFGPLILKDDGSLDRKRLGEIVFNDEEKRRELEDITHGLIREKIKEAISFYREKGDQMVFVVVPLLFEAHFDNLVDFIWLVTADEEVRISRIIDRDHLTRSEAIKRLQAQMPEDQKIAKSDCVIYNNGSKEEVFSQIDHLLSQRS